MPFDFTLLKDVPINDDAASAQYALVVGKSTDNPNVVNNTEVQKVDIDLFKSEYVDVTEHYGTAKQEDSSIETVFDYIDKVLMPIAISAEGGKKFYINNRTYYYFIDIYKINAIGYYIVKECINARVSDVLTEYIYGPSGKISEIRHAPNKLTIRNFTDFENGLTTNLFDTNLLKLNISRGGSLYDGTVELSASKSRFDSSTVLRFGELNTLTTTLNNAILRGIANPVDDNDAVNKKYLIDYFDENIDEHIQKALDDYDINLGDADINVNSIEADSGTFGSITSGSIAITENGTIECNGKGSFKSGEFESLTVYKSNTYADGNKLSLSGGTISIYSPTGAYNVNLFTQGNIIYLDTYSYGTKTLPLQLRGIGPGTTEYDAVNFGQLSALSKRVDDINNIIGSTPSAPDSGEDGEDGEDSNGSSTGPSIDLSPYVTWYDLGGIYDSVNKEWSIDWSLIEHRPTYICENFIQSPIIAGGSIYGGRILGGSLEIGGDNYKSDYHASSGENGSYGSITVYDNNGNTTFKADGATGKVEITGKVTMTGGSVPWDKVTGTSNVLTSNTASMNTIWNALMSKVDGKIDDMVDNTSGSSSYYGTCDTGAGTEIKQVRLLDTAASYQLKTATSNDGYVIPKGGTRITVLFNNKNTSSNTSIRLYRKSGNEWKQLTKASYIRAKGAANSKLSKTDDCNWNQSNSVVEFIYDNINDRWQMTNTNTAGLIGSWCHATDTTTIDGSKIYTGSITVDKIDANLVDVDTLNAHTISANKITSGTLNAANIKLFCANNATIGSDTVKYGGGFAFAKGAVTKADGTEETTYGAKMFSGSNATSATNYIITTNAGSRMSSKNSKIYTTEYFAELRAHNNGQWLGAVKSEGSNVAMYTKQDGSSAIKHYIQVLSTGLGASTSISSASDRRLKRDISYNIDKYKQIFNILRPASFLFNNQEDNKEHLGFIAQDVEDALLSNGITLDNTGIVTKYDDKYGIAYTELIALNTAMIQDLLTKIDNLEKEIADLKSQ